MSVLDPVMSTSDLAERLGAPDLRVLDASWFLDGRDARSAYREAHVPGAVFFDIDAHSDATSGLPHMLLSPEAFAKAVGALGVAETDHIVVYDQAGLFSAARVWWNFRVMGASRVQVLDGGLPKWLAEGRPTEFGSVRPAPASFSPRFDASLVRDFKAVSEATTSGAEQIADARSAARFRGEAPEPRAGVRGGHMPSARNVPYGEVLNNDGTLRSAEALATVFADAGLDVNRPITLTCGSGVTASVLALALARLGRWNAPVYDGSWSEWGSRPDTVVVTGPA